MALIATAITLGICTVTLWTPYPVRHDPLEEMIAGPADEGRTRPRVDLSPLIPAGHGVAALVTFMLALLTAVNGAI